MHKPSRSVEKNIVHASEQKEPSPSSAYAESVRMTPERLLNAVIKTTRQGGAKGVRDE